MREPNFDSRPTPAEETVQQTTITTQERKEIVEKPEAEQAVYRVGLILMHGGCEVAPFSVARNGEPTAQGIACVHLDTMFKSNDVDFEGRVEMLVADPEGTIASSRYVEITRNRIHNPTELHAFGRIITFLRGQGYATGSELAFLQTMQHIADSRGITVRWTIGNENIAEQHELEKELAKATKARAAILERQIEAKKKEQQAWESLYGIGGKLGMEVVGKNRLGDVVGKIFTPGTPAETALNETVTTPITFPKNPEGLLQNQQFGKDFLAQIKQRMGMKEINI